MHDEYTRPSVCDRCQRMQKSHGFISVIQAAIPPSTIMGFQWQTHHLSSNKQVEPRSFYPTISEEAQQHREETYSLNY